MKSLLNNPRVTAALAVLALGVLAWRLVGVLGPRRPATAGASVAAAPGGSPAAPGAVTHDAATRSPQRLDQAKRSVIRTNYPAWLQAPARNPFLRVAVQEPIASAPKPPTPSKEPPPPPAPLPVLSGILRSGRGQLAILNNQVLGRGADVGSFKVVAIGEGEVTVRDAQGVETVLALPGSPAARRAMKTNAPPSAAMPNP